jgi:hypothetical protein
LVDATHSPNFLPGSGGVAFLQVIRAASLGLAEPLVPRATMRASRNPNFSVDVDKR